MATSRSVFSNRFHMSSQDRRDAMLKPVPDGSKSASDALARMGNAVPRIEKIKLAPYSVPVGNDDSIEIDPGVYALTRLPGWEMNKRASHLAIVGENYQVITPDKMARAWDDIIGMTPTGMQFQRGGTSMIMEVKVDEFTLPARREDRNVGDVMERNFFVMNPTDGGGSVTGGLREVRLVCTNGIIRREVEIESFKVKHDERAFDFMCEWMAHIWALASKSSLSEVAEQYIRLTQARATIETIKWINTALYPLPDEPKQSDWDRPRKSTYADALDSYEYRLKKTLEQHQAIEGLFNGAGTAIYGETAFDALNAFTEWENFRKGTLDTQVAETINGDRASNMQKAWGMLQSHLESPVLERVFA